ncbi:TMV resistance protein N-like [Melia azedarach]|uniref:TMV resistance protein N-like n=1 Tax=Melia azedarach TaxID=155640 RepID=A0ACC1XSH9_MELAZ|nr:TMV resistance protein N-like [Melia azedarach]
MDSLRKLALSGCSKLKKFPEILRGTKCLSELLLDGTDIKELPLSLQHLPKLVLLNLENCKKLESLPSEIINGLKHLKTLNLSGCSRLEIVPENMEKVESLEELNISGTAIRQPAEPSIFLLRNLKALSFRGCKGTAAATSWFSWLSISRSLDPLGLILPSLSGLSSLKKLDLSDCNLGEGAIPIDICSLFSLEELNLSKNEFSSLPENISHLSKLKSLKMVHCKRLQSLPKLPCNINEVRVHGCVSLETLSDALKSCNSEWIEINCLSCLKLASDNDLAYSML